MEGPLDPFPCSTGSMRRDTISTTSSDRQPSLPTGRWPLTIHGNCARCGHHHKAAVIHIHVVDGVHEASHVICDRCGQKWLTIGGTNNTQISLLSTVTNDLDYSEIRFRYTLFSMVRSATSLALPAALTNVPEDPSSTPSHGSSARRTRDAGENTIGVEHELSSGFATRANPAPEDELAGQYSSFKDPPSSAPILRSIKRKLKHTIGILKKVRPRKFFRKPRESNVLSSDGDTQLNTGPRFTGHPSSTENVFARSSRTSKLINGNWNASGRPAQTMQQIFEDLKSVDPVAIRNMVPKQRDIWIRERITAFKRSKYCSQLQCNCKRRHSMSSIADYGSLLPHPSAAAPTLERQSLAQMGSQFDTFPAGALFTHTGPLTISATRISEADTAVDQQEGSASLRSSHYAHRSRSPRPASLLHSRLSWQQHRHSMPQRDSMDSVLVGTARTSWRGGERISFASAVRQEVSAGCDASTGTVVEDLVSTTHQRSQSHG